MLGKVSNNSNKKTIAVLVTSRRPHSKYKKLIKTTKKYQVHIENEKLVNIGDHVVIKSSRPISKMKKWKFVRKEEK